MGLRSLGLHGEEWVYLLQERVFLISSFFFFLAWKESHVKSCVDRGGDSRAQKPNQLQISIFLKRDGWGLASRETFLCNHTICWFQGTSTVNKAQIPSKMGVQMPGMGDTASPTGPQAAWERSRDWGSVCSPTSVTGSPAEDHTFRSKAFLGGILRNYSLFFFLFCR